MTSMKCKKFKLTLDDIIYSFDWPLTLLFWISFTFHSIFFREEVGMSPWEKRRHKVGKCSMLWLWWGISHGSMEIMSIWETALLMGRYIVPVQINVDNNKIKIYIIQIQIQKSLKSYSTCNEIKNRYSWFRFRPGFPQPKITFHSRHFWLHQIQFWIPLIIVYSAVPLNNLKKK